MTLEELKNFNPNTHEIYHVRSGNKYSFNYKWATKHFYPDIILESLDKRVRFTFYDDLGTYNNVEVNSEYVKHNLGTALALFETKPKQKESKMKTTFKQEPTKTLNNSFPKFMKSKTTSLVVLFFNETSGVVVVGNSSYNVNDFSYNFNINTFEPIENCEVTFSNKE